MHTVSRLGRHTFGKGLSMRRSSQSVRHGDSVQPCLIRSHPGTEQRQEPDSASMESPLACDRVARRAAQEVIQDKPPPPLLPFSLYFAGVMQDKSTPNFVVQICTIPLQPHDRRVNAMYFLYILLVRYIACMHRYLLY